MRAGKLANGMAVGQTLEFLTTPLSLAFLRCLYTFLLKDCVFLLSRKDSLSLRQACPGSLLLPFIPFVLTSEMVF